MNLRTRVMIIGGVLGALLGVGAAYLYLRSVPVAVDDEGQEQLPAIEPGKALAVSVGLLGVLRQITSMSQPPDRGRKGRKK